MPIKSFNYKNTVLTVSKHINTIAGANGSGKSILLNGLYALTNKKPTQSELITDLQFTDVGEDFKVFHVRQDDLITKKRQIIELIKEHTNYNSIKSNLEEALSNLRIEDKDDHVFQLKHMNERVQQNLKRFQHHRKLIQEKEKIEIYIRSKESRKLCDKIIEIQDKISKEEEVIDNFENEVAIIKREKLEKEIEDLESKISSESNIIERKKILWREESKIKENIKKYRHDRRVIDLIEFDQEVTDAVISVLGNRLKAKVVQYEDEALDEIKNLKYRQTYLVMDKIENLEIEDVQVHKEMIPLKKLIKTKVEYNRLKEFLFKDIFLVKNFDTELPNKILVTLSGQVLHRNGALTGGFEENKELKEMFEEKEIYRKRIERLKEIEKELKKINDSSINDTKDLILKIIAGKKEELNQIKTSKTNINFNLEKLKTLLARLIDQKKAITGTDPEYKIDQDLERKNLNDELGRINKEMREIMINRKIDYEDIGRRIEDLLSKNDELIEDKIQMEQISKELELENEKFIKENTQKICDRISHYYGIINGQEFKSHEISSDEMRSSSIETKENFDNFLSKVKEMDEPNDLLRKIHLLSGGQLQMLTLAFLLSLHEIVHFDILFLDEIDSNLDETKIVNLNKLLSKLKCQIFQVTHRRSSLIGEKFFFIEPESIKEHTKNEMELKLL